MTWGGGVLELELGEFILGLLPSILLYLAWDCGCGGGGELVDEKLDDADDTFEMLFAFCWDDTGDEFDSSESELLKFSDDADGDEVESLFWPKPIADGFITSDLFEELFPSLLDADAASWAAIADENGKYGNWLKGLYKFPLSGEPFDWFRTGDAPADCWCILLNAENGEAEAAAAAAAKLEILFTFWTFNILKICWHYF